MSGKIMDSYRRKGYHMKIGIITFLLLITAIDFQLDLNMRGNPTGTTSPNGYGTEDSEYNYDRVGSTHSSRSSFEEMHPKPCEQNLQLYKGWNLISFFVDVDEFGDEYTASVLAAEINQHNGLPIVSYLVKWDPIQGKFVEYVVATEVGENFAIIQGEGYYLYVSSPFPEEFSIVGDCSNCDTLQFNDCWNLLGWLSPNIVPVDDFVRMVNELAGGDVIQAVAALNNDGHSGKYINWYPGDPAQFPLEPGKAYWFFSSTDFVIPYFWCKINEISNPDEVLTEKALSLMNDMNLSVKIGQMIMPYVATFDRSIEVESFLRDGIVGGIYVTRNSLTTDTEAILNFTNWLNEQGSMGTGTPLLIAGDFEGGKIMNYANLMSHWSNNLGLGAANSTTLTYQFGKFYGAEMDAIGFNMAFSPVLDVNTNPDNPVIGPRSIGSDPDLVTRLGLKILQGHKDSGIISTLKHFPGHGDTSVDSHSGLPILEFNRTRLDQVELAPFKAAVEAGVPAIMTAHIAIPAIDPTGHPATLSEPILTGLLRGEMGYQGLIITDAIEMGAIRKNYGVFEAARMAILAGVDILHTVDRSLLYEYHQFLMDEVIVGNIAEDRINASVLRILKCKLKYGLFDRYPQGNDKITIIRSEEHVQVAQEIANTSITLVNDSNDMIPLAIGLDEPILIVSPDNLLLGNGNLSLTEYLGNKGYNVSQLVISHQVTSLERDEVIHVSNESSLVIFATHNFRWHPTYYGNTQIELAEEIYQLSQHNSIPVILLSVENPYDLIKLPDFPTRIVAYTSSTTTMQAVANALTGEIEFKGELPILL